jgi:hypothetical protein
VLNSRLLKVQNRPLCEDDRFRFLNYINIQLSGKPAVDTRLK